MYRKTGIFNLQDPMISQLRHLPADSQVLKATKFLVRQIHQRGLKVGDRLPSQAALRQSEFSNDTLSGAMQILTDAGTIVRQVGRGTTVKCLERQPEGLWTIGLLVQNGIIAKFPFYAQLFSLIQEAMVGAGLRSQMHLQRVDMGRTKMGDRLDTYHLLRHDLEEDRLDGILTLANLVAEDCQDLQERGIPVVHVGSWEGLPRGAVIDRYTWVKEATEELYEQGARQFGIVSIGGCQYADSFFYDGHLDGLAACGLSASATRSLTKGEGISAGKELGKCLLAEDAKPDALIVVDDRIAMGLISVLAEDSSYRPKLAVQTNRQAPFTYALPITAYEVDAQELVRHGIEIMLASLNNPKTSPEIRWLAPVRAESHESYSSK